MTIYWPKSHVHDKKLKAKQDDLSDLAQLKVAEFILTDSQAEGIESLLGTHKAPEWLGGQLIWVFPRAGTVSPWASKTLNLIQQAGFKEIKKIEQGKVYGIESTLTAEQLSQLKIILYDPLVESIFPDQAAVELALQSSVSARVLQTIPILVEGKQALMTVNQRLGLALDEAEMHHIESYFKKIERDPTDVELMMFAQINSEHCRHKIFNADFIVNGENQKKTLFKMIKHTYEQHAEGILTAYDDNAAVLKGPQCDRLTINPNTMDYNNELQYAHMVIKVETHNHPTAICPFPGAATGAGGEIRDEVGTGCGARSKAGLVGFSVSNLHIPGYYQPWELNVSQAPHQSSSLHIMLEGPIGAASFQNEFGRPGLCGYFRTLDISFNNTRWGYHKPIMLAGGMGNITAHQAHKRKIPPGAALIVLGGPGFAIGIGGGAASSVNSGSQHADLDFASVQRSNPEMQRRCQGVVDSCTALDENNPIISIHDVGAGGLSNALTELVNDHGLGADIDLCAIPIEDPSMSPLEIWCNESQERYVLALLPEHIELFTKIAERERCPFSVVGYATNRPQLLVTDKQSDRPPIDVPMNFLFGSVSKKVLDVPGRQHKSESVVLESIELDQAIERVLQLPAVSDKSFLITIGDRTVGGLVMRDQMVGPWQVPVSDVAVTASGFDAQTGEAMAIGERTPVAILSPEASARMAVGEAITNIAAADIKQLSDVKLSANWMASCQTPGESAGLLSAVKAVGMALCPELKLTIPVGKDSLSMQTHWNEETVTAPLSLIISAFSPVQDVVKTLTPQLQQVEEDTELLLLDLAPGYYRLGGSALLQTYNQIGDSSPDLDHPSYLSDFFEAIQALRREALVLAYHDRSDGGLLVCVAEMMFAGRLGVDLDVSSFGEHYVSGLFCEELGAVIQIRSKDRMRVRDLLIKQGLGDCIVSIGQVKSAQCLRILRNDQVISQYPRAVLQQLWSKTSFHMQSLRDNEACAQQVYDAIADDEDPGLQIVNFSRDYSLLNKISNQSSGSREINLSRMSVHSTSPRVAVLREQGINGHYEMAAAWMAAGFQAVDVTMTDLQTNRANLSDFQVLAICGGFSYGDVLGAGQGWAMSILHHPHLREQFQTFFSNPNTLSLGVCNGCQMFSHLTSLIPGSDHWPTFNHNQSHQFEARLSMVEVMPSPSLLFQGLSGAVLPIAVSHGEGHLLGNAQMLIDSGTVALQYVDQHGVTERYPTNPNGSEQGITGLCNQDGRVTIMMPHPERVFQTRQLSWAPKNWPAYSPWFALFTNARALL